MTTVAYLDTFKDKQEQKLQKELRNAVFVLAQEVQAINTVSEEEVYKRLVALIGRWLSRTTLVEILEKHDDIINSNIRFWIIDIYDFIIARINTSWKVQKVILWEQSIASDKR